MITRESMMLAESRVHVMGWFAASAVAGTVLGMGTLAFNNLSGIGCGAATGRILAESDFFEPMTFGSLITRGFGGRVYFATGKGFIVLQVRPKAKP